jgi:hypothetical protein
MATNQYMKIIIDAENRASEAFESVNSKLKEMDGSFKTAVGASQAVGIALGAAGVAAAAFGGIAVKAAADSELAWMKVGKASENAGLNMYESVPVIQMWAAEIQKTTQYSDEYAGLIAAKFLPLTKDVGESIGMANLALDLEAAGFANADTATRALSAAHEGDIQMLARYVPAIRGLDADILKTMTTEQKWYYAQELLQDQVGGTAKAVGETFAGKVTILKNSWDEFLEKVGGEVLPVLATLLDKVVDFAQNKLPLLIDRTKEIISWMTQHKEIMIIVAGAIIGALVPALIVLAGTMWAAVTAFAAGAIALAPFILGGAAVAGIVLGILWIVKHWDLISAKTTEIWTAITNFLSATWAVITGAMQTAWTGIANFFTAIWEGMKFAAALIVGAIIEIFNFFGIDILRVMTDLQTAITLTWDAIRTWFNLTMDAILAKWSIVWTAVRDFLAPIVANIKTTIQSLWDWMVKIFNEMAGPVTSAWNTLWTAIGDGMKKAWDAIYSSLTSGINSIIDKVNGAIGAINNVAGKGAGALGISTPKLGSVPKLAEGGIVTRPTLALIGEAGPEAVVPLRMAGAGMGGITINITGNSFLGSEGIAEKIGKDLMKILRRNVQI